MNMIKDRAIWIVLVLIIMAGIGYMLVVDPDRVDKMDNIVERDDERKADVTETNELIDRIDKKLIGTKKHLQELRDEYDLHIKAYDSKVDSINNAFSKVDLSINKILRDMKDKFAEVQDQLEELEDGEVDQHEASVKIGQVLKEMYIDSALKTEKQYEAKNKKHKKKYKKPEKKITWEEYKRMVQQT